MTFRTVNVGHGPCCENVKRILDANLHTWQTREKRFIYILMSNDIQMCWIWVSKSVAEVCKAVWWLSLRTRSKAPWKKNNGAILLSYILLPAVPFSLYCLTHKSHTQTSRDIQSDFPHIIFFNIKMHHCHFTVVD